MNLNKFGHWFGMHKTKKLDRFICVLGINFHFYIRPIICSKTQPIRMF